MNAIDNLQFDIVPLHYYIIYLCVCIPTIQWYREHKPEDLVKKAVHGMMQKNKLKKYKSHRLKVYADAYHPHVSQVGILEMIASLCKFV